MEYNMYVKMKSTSITRKQGACSIFFQWMEYLCIIMSKERVMKRDFFRRDFFLSSFSTHQGVIFYFKIVLNSKSVYFGLHHNCFGMRFWFLWTIKKWEGGILKITLKTIIVLPFAICSRPKKVKSPWERPIECRFIF